VRVRSVRAVALCMLKFVLVLRGANVAEALARGVVCETVPRGVYGMFDAIRTTRMLRSHGVCLKMLIGHAEPE